MAKKLYQVPFFPGDGTTAMLRVKYIAEFPRDAQGFCAYCHGDPCAELSKTSRIAKYFKRNKAYAESCPCCNGRPS